MSNTCAPWLLLFAFAVPVAGCGAEPSVTSTASAYHTEVQTRVPDAERVVALGDIHGDIDALREALWLGGLTDEDDRWVGGETVVVQTGDLLDRGDEERAVIDLLKQLQADAEQAGGSVHLLHGNHELMNVDLDFRYVSGQGFADFEDAPGVDPSDPAVDDLAPHMRARGSAFMPGGSYAAQLASHPVVLIVGDTVFAHGGVLPSYASNLEQANDEVAQWLLGHDDGGRRVLEDDESPVWSRHYSDDPSSRDCRLLRRTLDALAAERMVVGHTPQGTISSACDDRVWRIDVAMGDYYGGGVEILELTDAGILVLAAP